MTQQHRSEPGESIQLQRTLPAVGWGEWNEENTLMKYRCASLHRRIS